MCETRLDSRASRTNRKETTTTDTSRVRQNNLITG